MMQRRYTERDMQVFRNGAAMGTARQAHPRAAATAVLDGIGTADLVCVGGSAGTTLYHDRDRNLITVTWETPCG